MPDSLFRYEVRNGADLTPDAVGVSVRERFGGTVITSKPLSIPENGLLPLAPVDGLLLSSDQCTIGFFQKENGKDRNTEEVEAESVSYAVCQYYGIETGANSFGYIATWSEGRELKELRASLETITKATSQLISDIDKHFKEICKERGIKLSEQKAEKGAEPEKESAPETPVETTAPEADTPEVPAADTEKEPEKEPEPVPNMETAPVTVEPPATEAPAPEVPAADTEKEPEKEPEPVSDVKPVPEKTEPPSTETAVETVTPPEQEPVPDPEAADAPENATPEPEQPDTTLDEYPLPDTTVSPDALAAVGYTAEDLLPLSLDRACELMDRDMSVYMLQTGENPAMAFDSEELREQPEGTLFALPRDEWEASSDFQQAVDSRMERQEEREAAFLNHAGDCFAIYQVRPDDELRDLRYEPLDRLQQRGQTPERGNYDLAYTAPLPEGAALDTLFARFNTDHPPDYRRPSVSVSDILAIHRDGVVTCSYVDRFGFVQLPGFLEQENPLKNAELLIEDDRNMIDGIINNGPKEDAPPTVAELEAQARSGQPISLLELAAATRREDAEKQHGQRPRKRESVLAKLRQIPPESGKKRTAPKKSAERGL